MFVLLLFVLFPFDQLSGFELELDINEEEIYGVLGEASAEVDELDDVLFSCNENAEIYTKSTIKNLFRSSHFNRADAEDQPTNHVVGWQVLNEQKHFATNSTYLLIKQTSHKDSGIYYCIFRVPYLSFFSSILPNALVSNLSRLWAGCQAIGQFECLASFKYKLIVRKAKRRSIHSIALPDDFKESCFIIKNGKQIAQYKTLSLIAMFLASMIFFLLLFYFISIYRDNLMAGGLKLKKKCHKKQVKKLRNEQIDENLKIIKSFEHIKEDEQQLLRRLRHEQERLSSKRREDEEFFNKIKIQELDLVKRREEVVKEEEELLKKQMKFENEKKARDLRADEERIEMKKPKSEEARPPRHLDEAKPNRHLEDQARRSSSGQCETNLKNLKGLDNLGNLNHRSINLNIKGEIKLKPPGSCDENKQLVELENIGDVLDLNGLCKKLKKSRKSIFSPVRTPDRPKSADKQMPAKHRDSPDFKLFNSMKISKKADEKSPNRQKPNLDRLNEDRKKFLKRKLIAATHIGANNSFRDDLKKELKAKERNRLSRRSYPLAKLRKVEKLKKDKQKERPEANNGMLDVESMIDITRRNQSIFKTKGKFKMDSGLCDKPIKWVVECGPLPPNKASLTK